jgi:hypothetical protein
MKCPSCAAYVYVYKIGNYKLWLYNKQQLIK